MLIRNCGKSDWSSPALTDHVCQQTSSSQGIKRHWRCYRWTKGLIAQRGELKVFMCSLSSIPHFFVYRLYLWMSFLILRLSDINYFGLQGWISYFHPRNLRPPPLPGYVCPWSTIYVHLVEYIHEFFCTQVLTLQIDVYRYFIQAPMTISDMKCVKEIITEKISET